MGVILHNSENFWEWCWVTPIVYPISLPKIFQWPVYFGNDIGWLHKNFEVMQNDSQISWIYLISLQIFSWHLTSKLIIFRKSNFFEKIKNFLGVSKDNFEKFKSYTIQLQNIFWSFPISIQKFCNQISSQIQIYFQKPFSPRIRANW